MPFAASASPVRSVLADRLRSRGIVTDAALVLGGAALTAISAQVQVPMWPVPITGQTLAVVLVGATLGARRGALSMLTYMVAGLVGLPVFAEFHGGPASVLLPSFGFVVGFVPAAAVIGWLARRDWDRRFLRATAAFTLASAIPFAVGLPYLAVVLAALGAPHDLMSVLQGGLFPFVIGGVAKALIAAGVLPLAWRILK